MNSNPDIPWSLGIDLGTGSCKSVVLACDGRILGFGASRYGAQDDTQRWKEQNPEALLRGMTSAVKTSLANAGVSTENCQGIGLGGAMHTVMAVDRIGRPLTGIVTWVDDRAVPQAQAVRASTTTHELYRRTGCPVHCIYPLYKIAWLREERQGIFHEARHFISAKEYVYRCLTGEYAVDPGIAAGTGLLDVDGLDWNEPALALAGIEATCLSPLCLSTYSRPIIDADLADQMGLDLRTKVVLGSSDAVNSSMGAGALHANQATCMVGSSGAYRIISRQVILDEQARSWCYAIDEQHWLVGGAINSGGLALTWLCDRANQAQSPLSAATSLSVEDLIALAGQVKPGAEGLICLPFFAGERSPQWNMNAKSVFWGLSLDHDLRHMARAVLEGVAFRIRSVKEVMDENGIAIEDVRASGGFTQSRLWLQIMADVLDQPLTIPAWGETSSLGAAFWVLLSNGLVEQMEDLAQWVKMGETVAPNAADAALYDGIFSLYKEIYAAMKNRF